MKRLLSIAVIMVLAGTAYSQSERVIGVSYNMGFATGDLHDFISKASFRGFNVDYREMVREGVGVGLDVGWNIFNEEMPDDAVYHYGDNIDYSGKQFRYSNHFPLLAMADYFINADKKVTPYVGFGMGMLYTEHRVDMGVYTFTNDAFQFAIKPEAGLLVDIRNNFALMANVKYMYGVKAGDLPSQGYLTVGIGFAYSK